MPITSLDDVTAWIRALALGRAETVVPVAGGVAVLHSAYAAAHDHNKLLVWEPCDAATLARDAKRVLGGAGCRHRLIEVLSAPLADALAPGLVDLGYVRSDGVVLVQRAPVGERPSEPPDPRVVRLDLPERIRAGADSWRVDLADSPPHVWEQLGARASTVSALATFLAVRSPAGPVAARADLYVRDGIAQIEDVHTGLEFRGHGLASLLVTTAAQRAWDAGARLVFLVATADDWPQQLYRKLGFEELGTTVEFSQDSTES